MHNRRALPVFIFLLLLALPLAAAAQDTPAADPAPTCAETYAELVLPPADEPGEGLLTLLDFSEERAFDFWANVDDDVMGGISESGFEPTDYGSGRFSGSVSLENNGGFSSLQARFRSSDLSDFAGIEITLCGDGKRYGFYLVHSHNRRLSYQGDFETTAGEWQTLRLAFADLQPRFFGEPVAADPLDAARLIGMAFIISDKQEGAFALEVARISAYQ